MLLYSSFLDRLFPCVLPSSSTASFSSLCPHIEVAVESTVENKVEVEVEGTVEFEFEVEGTVENEVEFEVEVEDTVEFEVAVEVSFDENFKVEVAVALQPSALLPLPLCSFSSSSSPPTSQVSMSWPIYVCVCSVCV